MIGLLAAAIPLAFYVGLPSTFWNFDGVACAAALELGNPVYFFHAQHLLYGFFGFLFWKVLFHLGLHRALPALQLFSSALTATALYFLWRTQAALSKDSWLAFFLTCAAGFSAVVWTWGIEAQVYPLGVLGLSIATYLLLSTPTPRMTHVGFWHAIAVLGHLVHVLWTIPVFYWIYKKKLSLSPYLLSLVGTVGWAYASVAFFVLRPYHGQGHWLEHWFKGSLGLTSDRSLAWHWPGWSGPIQWLLAAPGVLWGNVGSDPEGLFFPRFTRLMMVISIFFLAAFVAMYTRRFKRSALTGFSLLWLGVYAVFFSTWEPRTLCYRMSDLIPFTLLLLTAALAWPTRRMRLLLASGWMVSLGLVNYFSRALPMHDSTKNKVYGQTVALAKETSVKAMYLTAGGLPWMYLLYFTGRSAWDVHQLSMGEFDRSWSALQPRPRLYASSALLNDPDVQPWLTRHHLKIMPGLPWLEVS